MAVKVNGKLPDPKTQDDGLSDNLDRILRGRKGTFAAIVLLHAGKIEEDVASGERTPKMDIVAIELMEGADEELAMDMVALYRSNRTGQQETRVHEEAARRRRREYAAGVALPGGGHQNSMLEDVPV